MVREGEEWRGKKGEGRKDQIKGELLTASLPLIWQHLNQPMQTESCVEGMRQKVGKGEKWISIGKGKSCRIFTSAQLVTSFIRILSVEVSFVELIL